METPCVSASLCRSPSPSTFRRLPNDLPFSSERQDRVPAYHGREESRAPAPGVAARAHMQADRCGVHPLQRRVGQLATTKAGALAEQRDGAPLVVSCTETNRSIHVIRSSSAIEGSCPTINAFSGGAQAPSAAMRGYPTAGSIARHSRANSIHTSFGSQKVLM